MLAMLLFRKVKVLIITQAFEIWYFCGGRVGGMDIFSGFVELSFPPLAYSDSAGPELILTAPCERGLYGSMNSKDPKSVSQFTQSDKNLFYTLNILHYQMIL